MDRLCRDVDDDDDRKQTEHDVLAHERGSICWTRAAAQDRCRRRTMLDGSARPTRAIGNELRPAPGTTLVTQVATLGLQRPPGSRCVAKPLMQFSLLLASAADGAAAA